MTLDSGPGRKFWQIALADLERQLGTSPNGLSSAEAAARRLRYGPNTLEERRRLSLPLKFLSRFRNPLVIILLAAAVISALTGDLTSFIIISTIVLTSAALDTVQEFRAEQAAESLKVSVALKEQVLRDGQEVTVFDDEALAARLEETNLFCRITPVQKNRVILGLRHRGHVVGYLGDGINDAPSLHTSDVGISVDSAVDVTRTRPT
jgi:magnesium-transporting ATPase (P-type)